MVFYKIPAMKIHDFAQRKPNRLLDEMLLLNFNGINCKELKIDFICRNEIRGIKRSNPEVNDVETKIIKLNNEDNNHDNLQQICSDSSNDVVLESTFDNRIIMYKIESKVKLLKALNLFLNSIKTEIFKTIKMCFKYEYLRINFVLHADFVHCIEDNKKSITFKTYDFTLQDKDRLNLLYSSLTQDLRNRVSDFVKENKHWKLDNIKYLNMTINKCDF